MKTTLVAHLAVVGLLFGSTGADVLALTQDSHDAHDGAAGAPRPRLKLPRMRTAVEPSAPTAPTPPSHAMAPAGETPKLGVMINVTDDGLVISEVMGDTLADAAGMQPGDMLLKMDGRMIEGVEDIRDVLSATHPGGTLSLTVVREGEGLVKLQADIPRPQQRAAPRAEGPDGHKGGFLGVQLGESGDEGVLVDGVVEQSAAWFAGLDKGDVLVKIGKTAISSSEDVVGAIASQEPGSFVKLTYLRDGEQQNARVRLGSRAPAPGALGSLLMPGAQGSVRFGPPGAIRNGLRFVQPDGSAPLFGVQGPGAGAQVFTHDGDDGDGAFWVFGGDDDDGSAPHVMHFDSGDIGAWVDEFSHGIQGHGKGFTLDLDDLEGLGDLTDGMSLGITFEDGVLTIDRDGEVQVLDLSDLEGLEDLDDDLGVHLRGLPMQLLQRFHDADGNTRFDVRVKRSDDAADAPAASKIRRLSFTPDADTTTTTIVVDSDCCAETAAEAGCEVEDAGCCDAPQETGDVN